MAGIEAKLAQEIVARAMRVIPFNVNVMDPRGIIIGSGRTERIGELHAGAQLALAQQRTVEIDAATARSLPDVSPGVNLPLRLRGQICGVVGLTGEPEHVRQFGELVRITAEMILEQAQLTGELQREKRYREEFVFHLMHPDAATRDDLEAWASRLGIDFHAPHAVVLIRQDDPACTPDSVLVELQRCQGRLAAQTSRTLSTLLSPRELAVIESFAERPEKTDEAVFARQRLQALRTLLQAETRMSFELTIGVAQPGIDGVAISYESACRTRRAGCRRDPQGREFSYYDLSLPVLLAGLDAGWQAEQLRRPLARLLAADRRDGTLRQTLEAWYAHGERPQPTARALGIHRNTLDYRLRQIVEATGLDLEKTDDRLFLYTALQLAG